MSDDGINPFTGTYWVPVSNAHPGAVALAHRHYSANPKTQMKDKLRRGISGPGELLTLLTTKCDALFGWQYSIRDDGQEGVNCTIFRNESSILSSTLIEEACQLAWERWPGQRLFTFVADDKIRSVNPGYCFKSAGWKYCGRTKIHKLSILEKEVKG